MTNKAQDRMESGGLGPDPGLDWVADLVGDVASPAEAIAPRAAQDEAADRPPTPRGAPRGSGRGEPHTGLLKISGTENSDSQVNDCDIPPDSPATGPDSPPTGPDSPATGPDSPATGPAPDINAMSSSELVVYLTKIGLDRLSFDQKRQLLELLEAKRKFEAENMLSAYRPYSKQVDFHTAGALHRERLLMAGNQLGKTYSAAAETAMHLTGLYPPWWAGKRFTRPVRGLAAGVTAQLVRDSMQVLLFGYPAKELGHGMVPKHMIAGEPIAARSITGAYDTVRVKHVSGGESVLYLRSYDQGREKVQAMTLDLVWLDEEPDAEYYTEALTRTNVSFGPVFMTFTPLKGMSETVSRFLLHKQGHVTSMTIDDVDHYSAEQKAAIIAQYPAHEREARTKGVPALGSGRVYPVPEEKIAIPSFPVPKHWPRLVGLDFGWSHPAAAVWLAWDRDADVVYVYDCYRAAETLIPVQAAAIKARGPWIPVSWPHDGHQVRDAMHGEQLMQLFRKEGVNMRPAHAQFPETQVEGERKLSRISTEAAIQEILTRMEEGRFKVFSHLSDWFQEFRLYHRKDGLLVKERDDLMSATHKAIMDLRFATVEPGPAKSIDHDRRSDGFI